MVGLALRFLGPEPLVDALDREVNRVLLSLSALELEQLRKCREATAAFQKSVNAFIRQGQYYGDVTWLLDYAEVLVMPRAANQGRNLAEGLQTTKRALSHSRCHEECLARLSVAWKSTKGSESDAARRLIRRSENGRLTLGAPYAERLQTQVPTTKSWGENASSS